MESAPLSTGVRGALISVGAGPSQVPLLRAARARGLEVVAVDRDPGAVGRRDADLSIVASTHDADVVLAELRSHGVERRARGIVCRSTGRALDTAARIAAELGLRGLDATAVEVGTSKSALRELCARLDLDAPGGVLAASPEDVPFPLPWVVKPDYTRVGKRSIRRVETRDAARAAIDEAREASGNGRAEVERFVDGVDVACAFWCHAGEAHAAWFYDELIGFTDVGEVLSFGVSMPTVLDDDERRRVFAVAQRIASALPAVSSLVFLCVRVDRERGATRVIELHVDLGGDRIAEDLLPATCAGVDLFDDVVRFATGGAPPQPYVATSAAMLLRSGRVGDGEVQPSATRVVRAASLAEVQDALAPALRARTDVAHAPRHLASDVRAQD